MQKLMLVGTAMTLLGGCFQQPDDNSIRDVLPEADSIQVKVPGAEASATSSGVKSQGLVGQTAEFYALTRKVTRDLNGGAAVILGLVKAITEYPVTSVEGGTWIWGPWREALNPSEYRLTVNQDAAGDYHWALEGRAKGSAGPRKHRLEASMGFSVPSCPPALVPSCPQIFRTTSNDLRHVR